MEHKQIPRVQWHTPHFCPLLDVTNTRGGRAKGRPLSNLVIQNFSNRLTAVWDYSRLPMQWVRNTRRAAKWLPGEPRWGKRKIQPPAHPYTHPPSTCISGVVYQFSLLILKPYNWGRFCQVRQEIRLMPRIWGEKNLKFSQSFLSFVHNKDIFLAHPINVLFPSANCRIVCAGGL